LNINEAERLKVRARLVENGRMSLT
jgi:hypothetical protein